MAVDYRLRDRWLRARRMLAPERVAAVLQMLHTHYQREGETQAEYLQRLKRQNDAYAEAADRREAEHRAEEDDA